MRTVKLFNVDQTRILFGDLDFTKFQGAVRDDGSLYLIQQYGEDEVIIDEFTYELIMSYLSSVHMIERDFKRPANNSTKMILIEDAREEIERNRNNPFKSQLKNLISAMTNSPGFKYDHDTVWDLKINAFMDSVRRICKTKTADQLMQSGYSGFGISFKDIDKKQLDWTGDL
jgi:hypothetical protein